MPATSSLAVSFNIIYVHYSFLCMMNSQLFIRLVFFPFFITIILLEDSKFKLQSDFAEFNQQCKKKLP